MRVQGWFVVLCCVCSSRVCALERIDVVAREDGKFLLVSNSCSPTLLQGFEFVSSNEVLVPFDSVAPFRRALHNRSDRVTIIKLAGEVVVEDELLLDADGVGGWDASRANEYDVASAFAYRHGKKVPAGWVRRGLCSPAGDDAVDLGVIHGSRRVVDAVNWIADGHEVSEVRLQGVGAELFHIVDFEPTRARSASFDVEIHSQTAELGVYSATLIASGFRDELVVPGEPPVRVPFTESLLTLQATIAALGDCNGDGERNQLDLQCISTVIERDRVLGSLRTLPGDLDGNGKVDFEDFLRLAENFESDRSGYVDGNIDLVHGIDFDDFLILSDNFMRTPNDVAALPEPRSAGVMLLAMLMVYHFFVRLERRSDEARGSSSMV